MVGGRRGGLVGANLVLCTLSSGSEKPAGSAAKALPKRHSCNQSIETGTGWLCSLIYKKKKYVELLNGEKNFLLKIVFFFSARNFVPFKTNYFVKQIIVLLLQILY